MTTTVDRIKRAVRITDLIGRNYQLDNKPGKRLRTTVQHDSLTLNTQDDTYVWYSKTGADGRSESGDVIDWAGRHELGYNSSWNSTDKEMFKEAVCWLARFAGMPDPEFRAEDTKAREERLSQEKLMNLALVYYEQQFANSQEAQSYAAGRGLTPETVQKAHLGYTGGITSELPPDKPKFGQGLTQAIPEGDRGRAVEMGLIRAGDKGGYYDAIPLGYLVYSHFYRGKVVYFSGRAIHINDQKLKSRNMSGPKKTFWVTWPAFKGPLMIVEGQADALSFGQLGLPALALCGTNLADLDIDLLELFSPIYYWADHDAPGQQVIEAMVNAAGPLLRLPEIPVYKLDKNPVKDVNDLLRLGATAEQFHYWNGQADTYLDQFIECASTEKARDEAMARLFSLLARLEDFQLIRYRATVCDKLNLSRGDFSDFLNLARGKTENNSFRRGEQYDVQDGWTVVYQHSTKLGRDVPCSLANASIKIEELVVYDNGSGDMRREYALSGKLANGKPLPLCQVPTGDYESMKWVYEHWPHVIITAGRSSKDQLREAIQHMSGEYPHRTIFEHTGWKQINGQWCYLTTTGALGLPPGDGVIEVNLKAGRPDTHMAGYALPLEPQNVVEAVRASLAMWDVLEPAVTVPYWAAAIMAPLSPFIPADFGLWPHGKTGSFKSVIAALAQAHYGPYWAGREARLRLPSNFISTVNTIAMNAFLAKDALMVVDDYAPGNTERDRRERDEVATRLLRSLGNKAARGRMKDGRHFQADYPPRCLAMITAEDLPPGQSILARGIGIRVPKLPDKDTPERVAIEERITRAQKVDAPLYCHAMSAYILWIQRNWEKLETEMPAAVAENHNRFKSSGHARLGDAFAKLMTAIDTFLVFAQEIEAITPEQAIKRREIAYRALVQSMGEHGGHIEALDPVRIFSETLREQLDAREWYLQQKEDDTEPVFDDWRRRAWCAGWQDDLYIYLLPKAVNLLMELYTKSGTPFPLTRTSLYSRLKESQKLVKIGTEFIPAVNTSPHVVKLLREAIYPEGGQG